MQYTTNAGFYQGTAGNAAALDMRTAPGYRRSRIFNTEYSSTQRSLMRRTLALSLILTAVLVTNPSQSVAAEKPGSTSSHGIVAETSSKVTWECPYIGKQKIQIDGKIDEAAWKLGKPLTN